MGMDRARMDGWMDGEVGCPAAQTSGALQFSCAREPHFPHPSRGAAMGGGVEVHADMDLTFGVDASHSRGTR